MIIFLQYLCKIVPLYQDSLITQSVAMDPKKSVINGLHCIFQHFVMNNNVSYYTDDFLRLNLIISI